MPTELKSLRIKEVSLVDRPANASTDPLTGEKIPHARIALCKRDEESVAKGVKYLVSGKDGDHLPYTGRDGKPDHRLMGAAYAALSSNYRGKPYEGPDKAAALARLKHIYEQEGIDTPATKSEGDSMTLEQIEKKQQEQDALLAKMAADDAATKAEVAALKAENEDLKMSAKEKKAFGAFSQKQKDDYMAADDGKKKSMMDDACKGMEEPDEDDKEKRKKADTDTVIKAAVAASEGRVAKAEERLAKVEAENAEIRKRERVAKFTAIAKSELQHTAGTDEQKGEDLLKYADAVGGEDTDAFKRHMATQKTADKLIAETRFREFGKWGGGSENSAHGQLAAKAEEIAKRDKCTQSVAYGKAMQENPQLYAQAEREKGGARVQ